MKNTVLKNLLSILVIATASNPIQVSAEVAATGSYKIDPEHSTVLFTVNHLGTSHLTGRFNTVAGNINFNPNSNSSVTVTIQTNSLDTNHQQRDQHLRSPDFFNVKQYPVIKFIANTINYNAKGEPTSMTGKLSLHGKTQTITMKISAVGAGKDPWGGYRAGYDASTTIKRSAFGMNFMLDGIGDEVDITLNIEATKI